MEEVTTMMLVDCETCPVRDRHCADCMVTALNRIPMPTLRSDGRSDASPDESAPLDTAERRAVAVLLAAGLVDRHEADRARARLDPPLTRRGRAAV